MQDATLRLLREREIEKLLLRNSLSRVDRLLLMPFRNEQNLNSFRSTNRVVLHCFRCVTPSQTGPFFSWQLSRLFIYDCFISCFRAWTFDVGLILCLTEQLYCQISRLISISAEKFCVARQRQRKQFRRVKMVGKSVYLSVCVGASEPTVSTVWLPRKVPNVQTVGIVQSDRVWEVIHGHRQQPDVK